MSNHIAILDDSLFMLHQTRAVLEQRGFEVSCYLDPLELNADKLSSASLVLVDVNMREVFGDDIVSYLKEQLGVRAPVVLFSGLPEQELRERAKTSGADGYVVKAPDITDQVSKLLEERHV